MNIKNLLLHIIASLSLVGCVEEIDDGQTSNAIERGDYAINIGGVIDGGESRVSGNAFEDDDSVGIYVINYSGGMPTTLADKNSFPLRDHYGRPVYC